ncbi:MULTISPECIES: enoyl-ACP reductase FabI [Tepidibacillus]|uniref:Enoyl-[acyl-carrier-protein] reductase [NADH] n=1 Tax=Tepidibacillus decaturensis TaxID=1413211 RepID=A0A135L5M1_9BACI|nr:MULTISPECIES: enoyl-ACP reductase FabI [Tepidibacillus]KXG44314.1 enoyl-ACP reductase [Tepidibacillus decaturensis]GBF11249.1 enoyl-[acyl-carrier-protein] reductase [NADH] FabI [Tepidibacillus sp. HK-1]
MSGQILKGKNILVMGVANKRSIAWAIANSLYREGARLIFTYQGERFEKNILELAEEMDNKLIYPCDVTKDKEISALFQFLKEEVGVLHGVVHSIAHAKVEELEGKYANTSRDGYLMAQEISVYSLVAVAREAEKLMTEGGSIIAMTYLGGERVVQNYNVMGVAKAALESSVQYLANDLGPNQIRVNAISAGPIRTLAAKGVKDFNTILHQIEEKAPLRRTTDASEVGDTALFLMSDWSRGITGEVIHVDSGYHILGL